MTARTAQILDILRAHDIEPDDHLEIDDRPIDMGRDFPEIGAIEEGETVYTTSIAEVFTQNDEVRGDSGLYDTSDPRLNEWWGQIEEIISGPNNDIVRRTIDRLKSVRSHPPEPHCAWYCPIHFFGHGWGIYIRESCILSHALDIASLVDWTAVRAPRREFRRQLLRSAFYVFFLHEQFHHKVESLGFRLLIASGRDRYRPYKANVYRPTLLTSACLEESLANAESYRRLAERRYVQRVDAAILEGLREYLRITIPLQPPGYREGEQYFPKPLYRDGLYRLQSQVLDGLISPSTLSNQWSVAPNMITALCDIADDIYVVLPKGARPIFRPTSVDPGTTVSSRALEGALTRFHGYKAVPGGKGSHVKLAKLGRPTIILPGNRPVLSPGVVKHALDAIGGYPLSRLADVLDGRI